MTRLRALDNRRICSRRAEEAAAAIRAAGIEPSRIAVVLGSGLNELADRLPDGVTIPYERVPHFPRTTVAGHQGQVIAGRLPARRCSCSRGGSTTTRATTWRR